MNSFFSVPCFLRTLSGRKPRDTLRSISRWTGFCPGSISRILANGILLMSVMRRKSLLNSQDTLPYMNRRTQGHTDTDAETDTATKMERYKIHRRYIYFFLDTLGQQIKPLEVGWVGWLDSLAVLNACQFVVSLSGFLAHLCAAANLLPGLLVSDCLPRPWNRENRLWPKKVIKVRRNSQYSWDLNAGLDFLSRVSKLSRKCRRSCGCCFLYFEMQFRPRSAHFSQPLLEEFPKPPLSSPHPQQDKLWEGREQVAKFICVYLCAKVFG